MPDQIGDNPPNMFDTEQRNFQVLGQIVADRTRSLVAWVGAGLSASAGLPGWKQLRAKLEAALRQKAHNLLPEDRDTLLAKLKAAREQENMWVAFRLLREGLGPMTYHTEIREALGDADRVAPPQIYSKLWRLRLSALLNLNLDRFASRAFASVHGTKPLVEFSGHQAASHAHILSDPVKPFVANLHGVHPDVTSWVFCDDDLNTLFANEGYRALIQACMLSRVVLFVGITADDVAAGGHMRRLRMANIDATPHFWITDRRDPETLRWADEAGILPILYRNEDGSHSELAECIDSLLRFVPREPEVEPVLPPVHHLSAGALLPPDQMVTGDPNTIRIALNFAAANILRDGSADSYARYEDFCDQYEESIHRAWFVPRRSVNTKLFDYTIIGEISRKGGFGTVYSAVGSDGQKVAIKLLHDSVRKESGHLQSFRRGVRSMRLLSEASVSGVVRYHAAFEIPALVVMDFIPGPTLHELVTQRRVSTWDLVVEIGLRVARIIRQSHGLPMSIRHRDLRPQNIMFREEWHGADDWDVVVLDFDLSWHKDSYEKSVVLESYSGYIAPEQIVRDARYSTRSALVDSYGVGMTLLFLRTGYEPRFMEPGQAAWPERLTNAARENGCREWFSLPNRFFRLVQNATRIEQPSRWDMAQIEGELTRLREALQSPERVRSSDLLAEELIARAFPGEPYEWDSDNSVAERRVVESSVIRAAGGRGGRIDSVEVVLEWTRTADVHRATSIQWAIDTTTKICDILRRAGWEILEQRRGGDAIHLVATMTTEHLAAQMSQVGKALRKASDALVR